MGKKMYLEEGIELGIVFAEPVEHLNSHRIIIYVISVQSQWRLYRQK